MPKIASDAINEIAETFAENLEYELRGAWRAGYDYVHLYDDVPAHALAKETPDKWLTVSQYILPSHSKRPPSPDERVYRYTYDLTSVDDDTIRAAIRGDVDV